MEEQIINLYKGGKSLSYISYKFNLDRRIIKTILKDNNIEIRTRKEQNKIQKQKDGMKVDHKFFDSIDTPQKGWILGFLATRICYFDDENNISALAFDEDETCFFERIKEDMKSKKNIIYKRANDRFLSAEMRWRSGNHKRKLIQKYGFDNGEGDGSKLRLPLDVSEDCQLAYILGAIDGNGGVVKIDDNSALSLFILLNDKLRKKFDKLMKDKFGVINKSSLFMLYENEDANTILDYIYNEIMIKNDCYFKLSNYETYKKWNKFLRFPAC